MDAIRTPAIRLSSTATAMAKIPPQMMSGTEFSLRMVSPAQPGSSSSTRRIRCL